MTYGQTCPRCAGTGKIRREDLPAAGQKVGETCQRCGGTGKDKQS